MNDRELTPTSPLGLEADPFPGAPRTTSETISIDGYDYVPAGFCARMERVANNAGESRDHFISKLIEAEERIKQLEALLK